jgi:hypothetical protein
MGLTSRHVITTLVIKWMLLSDMELSWTPREDNHLSCLENKILWNFIYDILGMWNNYIRQACERVIFLIYYIRTTHNNVNKGMTQNNYRHMRRQATLEAEIISGIFSKNCRWSRDNFCPFVLFKTKTSLTRFKSVHTSFLVHWSCYLLFEGPI